MPKKSRKMLMMMMKAAKLGWAGPGTGQKEGKSRPGAKQEQGRSMSRAGAGQKEGRGWVGAGQELGMCRIGGQEQGRSKDGTGEFHHRIIRLSE